MPQVLILVFLTTLVFYVRLALFHFTYWGHFFSFYFFFAFLSAYSGGERGGNFAISEETLNMFNIFFSAYQLSFTRGDYHASRVLVAVVVTRWKKIANLSIVIKQGNFPHIPHRDLSLNSGGGGENFCPSFINQNPVFYNFEVVFSI